MQSVPHTIIYPLLTQTRDKTLCGPGVVPIVIDRSIDTSNLHLTTNEPTHREMSNDGAWNRAGIKTNR